ncbi:MAG: tetratricopeptide repeat protein [Deltaproteobacteria bacterium]|nr:tetratricopeptide repeat protein [Deltaproteobacteria bacterium]
MKARPSLSTRARVLLLACVPWLAAWEPFRTTNSAVEEGNAQLGAGKAKEALEQYGQAARQLPDEAGVHYNRGLALYQLGRHEEARQALTQGAATGNVDLRARSFYGLGNALFQLKKYKEAVEAYRRTLALRPRHDAAKWNLELALRRIQDEKKKEEQKKKDEEKKKQDQKKPEDQKKQQDQQDKQKQQGKDQDPQKQQKPEPKKDQPDGKKPEPKKEPPKERPQPKPQGGGKGEPKKPEGQPEVDRVLDALDRSDKKLQRNRARMMLPPNYRRPEKDW